MSSILRKQLERATQNESVPKLTLYERQEIECAERCRDEALAKLRADMERADRTFRHRYDFIERQYERIIRKRNRLESGNHG